MGYLQSTTSYVDFEWPVSGWYRRVARIHTCARAHVRHVHTRVHRQLVWSLFVPRSSRVRCIYIYIGVYNIYICTYTYIKRSTSSLSLYIYIPSISIFHRPSFKRLFPRPVSEAGLHGRHSRLGRDPSTIDSETRYRNLCARERPAPSLVSPPSPPAKPRENPRLIAISPLCGLPRRLILGEEGRGGGGGGAPDDFRFREQRKVWRFKAPFSMMVVSILRANGVSSRVPVGWKSFWRKWLERYRRGSDKRCWRLRFVMRILSKRRTNFC